MNTCPFLALRRRTTLAGVFGVDARRQRPAWVLGVGWGSVPPLSVREGGIPIGFRNLVSCTRNRGVFDPWAPIT